MKKKKQSPNSLENGAHGLSFNTCNYRIAIVPALKGSRLLRVILDVYKAMFTLRARARCPSTILGFVLGLPSL